MKPLESNDLYERLDIDKNATLEKIKSAFRKKVFEIRPDRNLDKDTKEIFILVFEAYETLIDSRKRGEYDQSGIVKESRIKTPQNYEEIFRHYRNVFEEGDFGHIGF